MSTAFIQDGNRELFFIYAEATTHNNGRYLEVCQQLPATLL